MKINVKKENVYLVSDVHGNLDLLKKGLKKIDFKKDDYLFILGDLIEKGYQNIEILDFVMDLKNKGYHIFVIAGNCDLVINEFINPVNESRLKYYSRVLSKTILNEFLEGVNIDYESEYDMEKAIDLINIKFKKYYDFINSMPKYIVLNENTLLIHADFLESVNKKILTSKQIDEIKDVKFKICGHMPVMMYNDLSLSPFIKDGFLYIDGGNNVVEFGGLNFISLNPSDLTYTCTTITNYKNYRVTDDFNGKGDAYYPLIYKDFELTDEDDFVSFVYNKEKLLSLKSSIKKNKIFDSFNIFLKLKKNDEVLVPHYGKIYSIVIKDNMVGLAYSKILTK